MRLKFSSKIFFLVLILFISILTIFIFNTKTTGAAGFLPVGGRITYISVCDEGILLTVAGIRPGQFILTHASKRTTTLIAPRTGQTILGIAGQTPIPCTIAGVPRNGGAPILIAGGSK